MIFALVCVLLGLAIGLSIGWVVFTPQPSAPDVDKPAPLRPLDQRYTDRAEEIVLASLPEGDPRLTMLVDLLAQEAWGHGVNDLREALARDSGLPVAMIDQACALAIEGMGRR